MPPSSQLRRRHHRHTGDRGLHAHVQPPHGSSVRMEEGRAFLQPPEGQACCSSGTAISRLRNTGNYDPDEVLVASGSGEGTVRLWETDTGRQLATLEGHSGAILGVALSADGQLVASGSGDGTVRLWDTDTGRPEATLHGHSGAV